MTPLITLKVIGAPVGQPRVRATIRGGHAGVYTDPKHAVHGFKAAIDLAWVMAGRPFLSGGLVMSARFVFPRPKSMTWKRKPMPREPMTGKPDLDNVVKAVQDALNGKAYADDAQIVRYGSVEKCYAAGDEEPHVMVWIGRA